MRKQKKVYSLANFHIQATASAKQQSDPKKAVVRIKGREVPYGIFLGVFSFLSHHDVKQASQANRFFFTVGGDQEVWRELFVWKAGQMFSDGAWKRFFNADKDSKQTNWKIKFSELDKNINKDEAFYFVKNAHPGCKECHSADDRKSKFIPPLGVNNLHFALPGTETIPKCLLFSSSRPTVDGVPATLRVWSLNLLSQAPHPLASEPFDLLHRGPHAGTDGLHNPSPYSVRYLSSQEIGSNVTKMYPVYTYYKEVSSTWEYAAICGDEQGQVTFHTGLCNDVAPPTGSGSPLFQTNGKVVALKCLLEEQGYSGFKQAYGCGFDDSGRLYDLQANQVLSVFPHGEGLNTDSADVSLSGIFYALGQVARKGQQQQGVVRLYQMTAAGPEEVFSQQGAVGPMKCIKFLSSTATDPGDCFACAARDGLTLWDRRAPKPQVKFANNVPIEQLAVLTARQLIACTSGPDLMLWDLRGGRAVRKLAHGHPWCSGLACDPHGGAPTTGVIISGGTDGSMRMWQVSHLWHPSRGAEDGRKRPERQEDGRRAGPDGGTWRGKPPGRRGDGRGRGGRGGAELPGGQGPRGPRPAPPSPPSAPPTEWPRGVAVVEDEPPGVPAPGVQPYRPPRGTATTMPPPPPRPVPQNYAAYGLIDPPQALEAPPVPSPYPGVYNYPPGVPAQRLPPGAYTGYPPPGPYGHSPYPPMHPYYPHMGPSGPVPPAPTYPSAPGYPDPARAAAWGVAPTPPARWQNAQGPPVDRPSYR